MEILQNKSVEIECPRCGNIISKIVKVKAGSEDKESSVNAYCERCDKWCSGKISGELHLDAEVLRESGIDNKN